MVTMGPDIAGCENGIRCDLLLDAEIVLNAGRRFEVWLHAVRFWRGGCSGSAGEACREWWSRDSQQIKEGRVAGRKTAPLIFHHVIKKAKAGAHGRASCSRNIPSH